MDIGGWHFFFWTVGRRIVRAHSCSLNFSSQSTDRLCCPLHPDTDGFAGGPLPEGAGR